MSRALAASRPGRFDLAEILQPLDPRPSPGPSAPTEFDECLEFRAGEFRHAGRDGLASKGWTFHETHRAGAVCRNDVHPLTLTGIQPA